MTLEDVKNELRKCTGKAASIRAWAKDNGVSGQYVGDVLVGRRDPGASILDALGLEKIVTYRKKNGARA